jgi:hypothetical protein
MLLPVPHYPEQSATFRLIGLNGRQKDGPILAP